MLDDTVPEDNVGSIPSFSESRLWPFERTRRIGQVAPMPDQRKKERYALRPDGTGLTVIEIWTGKPAMAGGVAQTALSEDDANHMLKLLNAQARRGDSSMRK